MAVSSATAGSRRLRFQASSSDGKDNLLVWRVLLDSHRRSSKKLGRELQWRKEKMKKRKRKEKLGQGFLGPFFDLANE